MNLGCRHKDHNRRVVYLVDHVNMKICAGAGEAGHSWGDCRPCHLPGSRWGGYQYANTFKHWTLAIWKHFRGTWWHLSAQSAGLWYCDIGSNWPTTNQQTCEVFLLSLHKVYSLLNFEFSLNIDSIKDYCEEFTGRRVILKTLKTLNICMCSALKPSERRKRGGAKQRKQIRST